MHATSHHRAPTAWLTSGAPEPAEPAKGGGGGAPARTVTRLQW